MFVNNALNQLTKPPTLIAVINGSSLVNRTSVNGSHNKEAKVHDNKAETKSKSQAFSNNNELHNLWKESLNKRTNINLKVDNGIIENTPNLIYKIPAADFEHAKRVVVGMWDNYNKKIDAEDNINKYEDASMIYKCILNYAHSAERECVIINNEKGQAASMCFITEVSNQGIILSDFLSIEKGYGKKLIEKLKSEYRSISLYATDGAVKAYSRMGFTRDKNLTNEDNAPMIWEREQ